MHGFKNGNWIELKCDMILGGIFNIWRYLTYSPPLRPCTAGLDVAKTRRLGVTCSRINSSSGNYGIIPPPPSQKLSFLPNDSPRVSTPQKCEFPLQCFLISRSTFFFPCCPLLLTHLLLVVPLLLKYYASSFTYLTCEMNFTL